VRKVDLSIELQILAFHAQRRSTSQPVNGVRSAGPGPRPPVPSELAAQA
jgi:hypothetical protein